MKTSDFDYHLPPSLIAQTPMNPRDHSRLMSLCKTSGDIQHHHFYDLPRLIHPGDVLVFNDSRVMPARLYGKHSSGGKLELLLLNRLSPCVWRTIGRPGRLLRQGAAFHIDGDINGEVLQVEDSGERIIRLDSEDRLNQVGVVPLPPYITEPLDDAERYQTVYARVEGSAAAPTAGLHFTPQLLQRLRSGGAHTAFVLLHVGWDSFRPVRTENPAEHHMHSEYWELSPLTAALIRTAKSDGRRIIAVGTTTVRLLENAAALSQDDLPSAGSGWADIFITPGYRFKVVDALITNFHLPRSTLLMLTSALAGRDFMLRAYADAVSRQYRFYSFGDAMFIH